MNGQLTDFAFETLSDHGGLARRGIKRHHDVAKQACGARHRKLLILCKGQHIRRLILVAIPCIQLLDGGIIDQCHTYFDCTGRNACRVQRFVNCRA